VKRKVQVQAAHQQLISSAAFAPLVGRATADRTRMHARIRKYTEILRKNGIASRLPELADE
jgi:hypothetical protein